MFLTSIQAQCHNEVDTVESTTEASEIPFFELLGTFWSPCGRRNEVVGGLRRLLVTSRTSSWVVPPPKVVFYKDAPECLRSERLYCSSAEGSLGTSQRGVFDRVRRRIPRDRLLRSRSGASQSGSSRSTTPSRRSATWEAVGKRLA